MKIIATIFQCKRVVLPYIFIKYCVPRMAEIAKAELKVFLIQHRAVQKSDWMETCKIGDEGIETVRQWTEMERFKGATIITHSEIHPKVPCYPSFKKGVNLFLQEEGDYHIWLEDDCIIMDKDVDKWPQIMKDKDVGVYANCAHILTARTITTPSFDKRMQKFMEKSENWEFHGHTDSNGWFYPEFGHPEYFMTQCCKTERGLLNPQYSATIHYNKGRQEVERIIKEIAPHELDLLSIDFPGLK